MHGELPLHTRAFTKHWQRSLEPFLLNVLSNFRFNLNKFLGHESRDAASIFADRSNTDSDWVKYAKVRAAAAVLDKRILYCSLHTLILRCYRLSTCV